MAPLNLAEHCGFCKRFKRPDQLMETHNRTKICVECAEDTNMCEICGSNTEENFSAAGQRHYEEDCL